MSPLDLRFDILATIQCRADMSKVVERRMSSFKTQNGTFSNRPDPAVEHAGTPDATGCAQQVVRDYCYAMSKMSRVLFSNLLLTADAAEFLVDAALVLSAHHQCAKEKRIQNPAFAGSCFAISASAASRAA